MPAHFTAAHSALVRAIACIGVALCAILAAHLLARAFDDVSRLWSRASARMRLTTLFAVTAFTVWSGGKTNAVQRGGSSLLRLIIPVHYATATSSTSTSPPVTSSNSTSISNAFFSAIAIDLTNVALNVEWSSSSSAEETIDIYSKTNLSDRLWSHLAQFDVCSSDESAIAEVPLAWLGAPRSAFFNIGLRIDSDDDELPDAYESLALGTDPCEPDSDGDGLNDGFEVTAGFDPLLHNGEDANPCNDSENDSDADGLTIYQESVLGTSILSADSDGDGIADGSEVPAMALHQQVAVLAAQMMANPLLLQQGAWLNVPLLADCSNPLSTDNDDYVAVAFYYGDPSSSASEKYTLKIAPVPGTGNGESPQAQSFVNGSYGICDFAIAFLKKGWRYNVSLRHASTDFSKVDAKDPDYALLGACGSTFVNFGDPQGLFGVTSVTDNSFSGEGKLATIDVYDAEITFCDPASWEDLDESRVVLDDELLRVRIDAWPCMTSAAQIKSVFGSTFTLSTDSTCPGGVSLDIPVDATFETVGGAGEIRFALSRAELKELGLLPIAEEDGVAEKATNDIGENNPQSPSNLSDSTSFNALNAESRHDATTYGNMDVSPPTSKVSREFFFAAGVEYLQANYSEKSSKTRQILNQADYFYASGHGNHASGAFNFAPRQSVSALEVRQHWTNDLECVVFAGCSILDIGDFVARRLKPGQRDAWEKAGGACSPGSQWKSLGPKYLLGYGWKAPRDTQGADDIAATFAVEVNEGKSAIEAWRIANDCPAGRNACAIDVSTKPNKYWYWKRIGFRQYSWDCKVEGVDW